MRKILCSFIASAGVLAAGSVWAASGDGVINTAQGLLTPQTLAAPVSLANLSLGNTSLASTSLGGTFMPSVHLGSGNRAAAGPITHRQAEAGSSAPDVASHPPGEEGNGSLLLAGLAVIVALVTKRLSG